MTRILNYPLSLREITSTTLFLLCVSLGLYLSGILFQLGVVVLAAIGVAALYSHFMYKRNPPLKDSVVLVTGCSSGMGKAVTEHLTESGVHVIAGVRTQKDKDNLLRESRNPKFLHPVIMDVTKQEEIEAAVEFTRDLLQSNQLVFHGIVNNAGYPETGAMELVPMERVRYQFEVNVYGQIAVTNAFLPLLRETADRLKDGYTPRIVFISSVVGRFSLPLLGVYCASKHALEAVGDGYRRELTPWGIDVVLVQPGGIATQFVPKFEANLHRNTLGNSDDDHRRPQEEAHRDSVQKVYDSSRERLMMAAGQTFFGSPDLVRKRVCAALYDRAPYPRYTVGLDSDMTLSIAKHLPDIMLDKVFQFAYGFQKKQKQQQQK